MFPLPFTLLPLLAQMLIFVIFNQEVGVLERGPLSLVRTPQEILD
jgi:hypothetical protein